MTNLEHFDEIVDDAFDCMQTIRLCRGKGEPGKSHCVMAVTSIVAGERFTDRPICVCSTITAALIKINDECPSNEIRERLLGHLPWLIIGTRGDDQVCVQRANMFAAYAAACAAANAGDAAARNAAADAASNAAARASNAAARASNAAARAADAAARAADAAADAADAAAYAANAAADAAAYANSRAANAAAYAASAVGEAAAHAAHAASRAAYRAAYAADHATDALRQAADAAEAAWEKEVKKFIDFIEAEIIPVYTTMPVEPGFRIEELITS